MLFIGTQFSNLYTAVDTPARGRVFVCLVFVCLVFVCKYVLGHFSGLSASEWCIRGCLAPSGGCQEVRRALACRQWSRSLQRQTPCCPLCLPPRASIASPHRRLSLARCRAGDAVRANSSDRDEVRLHPTGLTRNLLVPRMEQGWIDICSACPTDSCLQ